MKKVISLILSILLCLSIVVAPSYAEEETMSEEMKGIIEVLRMFDVIPEYYDYNVNVNEQTTRADFVNSAAKLINLGDYKGEEIFYYDVPNTHWAYNGICAMTQKGIVNGTGDKLFKPDEHITYEESYKILLSVLGYKEYAENRGGYPLGYVAAANTTGISKGVTSSEYVTLGDMFYLLYNAMLTEIFEPTIYADTTLGYQVSDQTVLSIYHGVYYDEGILEGAAGTTLDGDTIDKDKAEIEDVVYETEIPLADYLGMEIKFLYRYDKNDDIRTIIWARETGRSGVLDIIADNDASFNKENFELSYYDTVADKKKIVKLNRTMSVIYNGGAVTANVDEIFNKAHYTAKLIENKNGEYTAAIVKSYENIVVGGKSSVTYMIYDDLVAGNSISLDENIYENINLKNASGSPVSFSSIQIGNVLSVYKSLDKKYVEVIVNDSTVSGVVKKIKTDKFGTYVTIDDKEYYLRSHDLDFSMGDTLTAYLDVNGEIASYKVSLHGAFAGYMMNAALENNGVEASVKIKLLHESGKVDVYECAAKTEVDGIKYTDSEEVYLALCLNREFVRQVALFETDKDGYIRTIDTVAYNTDKEPSNSLRVNIEYTGSVHSKVNGVLGTVGVADGNTVIFSVPEKAVENQAEDKEYTVLAKNELPEDGRLNIESYKTKEDVGFEEYVLVRGYSGSSARTMPVLITGFGTKVNNNGEIVEFIEGYQGVATISLTASEKVSFSELKPGMIIKPMVDKSGEVIDMAILYDYRTPDKYVPGSGLNDYLRPAMGYVNNIVDGVIKIAYTDPAKVDQVMYTGNTPVLVYDTSADQNMVSVGTIADAITYKNDKDNCSKVFMLTSYLSPNLFILFN